VAKHVLEVGHDTLESELPPGRGLDWLVQLEPPPLVQVAMPTFPTTQHETVPDALRHEIEFKNPSSVKGRSELTSLHVVPPLVVLYSSGVLAPLEDSPAAQHSLLPETTTHEILFSVPAAVDGRLAV